TVTFTYAGTDVCGPVTFKLDYGDGSIDNLNGSGSVQHQYTGTCNNCIATLTVTNVRGATATKSVLTQINSSLLLFEDFNDSIANGFTVSSGTWTASGGGYSVVDGVNPPFNVSLSPTICNNCVTRVDAKSTTTTNGKNAYVVFDYVDVNNFKYAGFDIRG